MVVACLADEGAVATVRRCCLLRRALERASEGSEIEQGRAAPSSARARPRRVLASACERHAVATACGRSATAVARSTGSDRRRAVLQSNFEPLYLLNYFKLVKTSLIRSVELYEIYDFT